MDINDNILSVINKTPDFIQKGIAQRVKLRRLEMNLTQNALAVRANIPLPTYRRFETTGEISFRSLVMLAIVLGMTDDFDKLFSAANYQNIDSLLDLEKNKNRKRGRQNG